MTEFSISWREKGRYNMNRQPNGKNLFALLIELYADQEGVVIEYELEEAA